MGTLDRGVRVLVGLALAAILVTGLVGSPATYAVGLVTAILLATGATGFCPLYALFGLSTSRARS
jgi:hypothetical protein